MRVRALLLLAAICVASASEPSMADRPSPRVSEAIVLDGATLQAFLHRPTDALALRAWRDDAWVALPFQVDEFGPDGIVHRDGDGHLDDADEIAVMVDALGSRAPDGAWPPGIVSSLAPLLISVTDPLRPDWAGFAYLYSADSPVAAGSPQPPRVAFDRTTTEIVTARYTLGLARDAVDGYVGVKRLSLFGSDVDLVDRSKLRGDLRVLTYPYVLTEETLEFHTAWDVPAELRRVGPVRAILDDMARGVAYEGRIEAHIDLAGIEIPAEFALANVRASLDFNPEALPGEYRDANVPEGVAIDGQPDSIAATLTSRWREISLRGGRLVFLTAAQVPAGARLYYADDARHDPRDTGDGRSYGDNGVVIPSVDAAFATGLHVTLVVLAPDEATTPEQLLADADHPLVVSVALGDPPAVPTPTSGTPATTPSPHETATPTLVPTRDVPPTEPVQEAIRCFLPCAAR